MANSELFKNALMYSFCDKLAESNNVNIKNMPETYIAADIMYQGDAAERISLVSSFTRALEDCIHSHSISLIMFPEGKAPVMTLSDGSSFELITNLGKKKSWRASKSISMDSFFYAIGMPETEDIEESLQKEDALSIVSDTLLNTNSPENAVRLAASLVPITNFISMEIDQAGKQIHSTCFFYTRCGDMDAKVVLPQKLLDTRRQNATTLRCIYDRNWIFDFRIRKTLSPIQYRLEWFLKDYPIGVTCHTTPVLDVETQVKLRV